MERKYFRLLAISVGFYLLCFLFYNGYLVDKASYFEEFSSRIERVDKYIKGDWGYMLISSGDILA